MRTNAITVMMGDMSAEENTVLFQRIVHWRHIRGKTEKVYRLLQAL